MGSTSLRVSEETLDWIGTLQREGESKEDVLRRYLKPVPLSEMAGALTDEQADELREAIEESREADRRRVDDLWGDE